MSEKYYKKEFKEIECIFNNTIPLIFKVMAKQKLLSIYWPPVKDALTDSNIDIIIKNIILVALSSKCTNNYCFVSHSFFFSHSLYLQLENQTNNLIRDIVTVDEYNALSKICITNDILNRFTEFFSTKVLTSNEELFFDTPINLKFPIPSLVKYYEKINNLQIAKNKPVVSICMYCKNIKDSNGKWNTLETVISSLDKNSTFTHGICKDCFKKKL